MIYEKMSPNFFQFGALAVLGVGIWTAVDKSYLEILMRNQLYMSAAWVLVAVGAMTIILSLIGCTGSLTVGGNYRIRKKI